MRPLPGLLSLTLLLACSTQQVVITLLTPAAVAPDPALILTLIASWDGGQATAVGAVANGSLSLSLPSDVPVDLEIEGDAGTTFWRGERHGLVAAGGAVTAGVLLTRVGQIDSFPTPAAFGMPFAGMSATPLGLGQVLLAGGRNAAGLSKQAWIYDQASASVVPAPPLARARANQFALSLSATSSAVLMAGGDDGGSVEVYGAHPVSAPSLGTPEGHLSGAVAGDQAAYFGCGYGLDGGVSSTDAVRAFEGPPLGPLACSGGQIVQLDGGAAVITASGDVYLLPSLTRVGRLNLAREGFAAVADGQGGLLVTGGRNADGTGPSSVEDFSFDAGKSMTQASLDGGFAHQTLVRIGAAGFLVIGGENAAGLPQSSVRTIGPAPAFLPDFRSDSRPGIDFALSVARRFPAVAPIPGYHLVLIVSGEATVQSDPASGLDVFTIP